MPTNTPSPLAAEQRIDALDVVRGLAVLGILVMNIVEFGLPMAAYTNPLQAGGSEGADRWTWYVQTALFDGRMRALFSMLFGAGIVLLGDRLATRPGGVDLLLRRCLWLIPFGIAHRFALQWTGDILYIYGLLGVVAVAFRNLRPALLIVLAALCLAAFVPIELRKHHAATETRQHAEAAEQLALAGEEVPPELAAAQQRWERRGAPPAADAHDAEIAAMRGGWLDVAAHRYEHNHRFQHAYLYYYFSWDVFGMFLLGMGLSRLGFFAGRMRRAVYLALIGSGVCAAAASGLWAVAWADTGWSGQAIDLDLWNGMLHPWLRGLTALAWAGALILLLRTSTAELIAVPLRAVGRMAFTNYILQTVCCTTLFFGWGFGLYAKLSRSELMLVVAAVSLLQIVFSLLWLRWFRFGPLEWAWRSLTYWQRQPLLLRQQPMGTTPPPPQAPPGA